VRSALTISGNQAVLTRANPLAKLAAVFLITLVLALSIDWMSASVALVCELLLFPLAGLTLVLLWQRGWPLILAAAVGGWSTSILAPDSGRILLDAGIWSMSEGSLELGLGFLLRGLAIALPAVLLMSCTDPTDLADALAQKARLPHRFVLGTLAALRLVGLMAEEWQTIGMARRARGVGSRGNPWQRLRATLGQSFGLLVQAISGCWSKPSGVRPASPSPWRPAASAAPAGPGPANRRTAGSTSGCCSGEQPSRPAPWPPPSGREPGTWCGWKEPRPARSRWALLGLAV
jgi:energy-coupling factor transport system permease protein